MQESQTSTLLVKSISFGMVLSDLNRIYIETVHEKREVEDVCWIPHDLPRIALPRELEIGLRRRSKKTTVRRFKGLKHQRCYWNR
ncbi:hypothetical protein U1Q18_002855 [Sarracenia purpurea var. burkii]